MDKYDVNRLPVIENGKLIGIIARADIIKAIV
jgi:CBS domain-containing protein